MCTSPAVAVRAIKLPIEFPTKTEGFLTTSLKKSRTSYQETKNKVHVVEIFFILGKVLLQPRVQWCTDILEVYLKNPDPKDRSHKQCSFLIKQECFWKFQFFKSTFRAEILEEKLTHFRQWPMEAPKP